MNKIQLLDKYPAFVEEFAKEDTSCASAAEIIGRLRECVEAIPDATLIGGFDHQGHVLRQAEGQIADGVLGSRHLLFCLSNAIPNPLIASVRPRAISVVELADRFVISFLEAPVEAPKQLMAAWTAALRAH